MKTAIRAVASVLLSFFCCTSFAQTSFWVSAGGNLSQFNTPTTLWACRWGTGWGNSDEPGGSGTLLLHHAPHHYLITYVYPEQVQAGGLVFQR